ncbi:MAG: hypothetical protein R3D33_12015 [Hyphomicrobiaceae bacterium]
MKRIVLAAALSVAAVVAVEAEESFKLPKEVTPAMRSACEADVRRLCVGANPTVAKVKRCVLAQFRRLNMRCQIVLASAGFSP